MSYSQTLCYISSYLPKTELKVISATDFLPTRPPPPPHRHLELDTQKTKSDPSTSERAKYAGFLLKQVLQKQCRFDICSW